jgi:hypothetical protein
VTEYVETRKFQIPDGSGRSKSHEFELDLRSTDKTHINIRARNLRRMGYYVRTEAREVDFWHHSSMRTVTVYSLYKHEKSTERKYYPLTGRMAT